MLLRPLASQSRSINKETEKPASVLAVQRVGAVEPYRDLRDSCRDGSPTERDPSTGNSILRAFNARLQWILTTVRLRPKKFRNGFRWKADFIFQRWSEPLARWIQEMRPLGRNP